MRATRNTPYSIKEIKTFLVENDMHMVLLSETYVNNKTKLEFQCTVCEHYFLKSLNDIMDKKRCCPACGKNGVRINKSQMKHKVSQHGYEIIEFIGGDSNKGTLFKVKCSRNHLYDTSYREFFREENRSGSCKQCCNDGYTKVKKQAIKQFDDFIHECNYKYLGEEIQTKSDKRTFICENGHERNITFNSFEEQPDCPTCRGFVIKFTENDVREKFNTLGITYIDGFNSTTAESIIKFKCNCGKIGQGKYHWIISSLRCHECLSRKRWTYNSVRQFYENHQCELLEVDYISNKIPMKFICSCGEKHSKPFAEFKAYPMCRACVIEIIPKGELHHKWNPNKTTEDRLDDRKYLEYALWRESVYKRDNYTCQCCGENKGGNLVAHHILNYNDYIDLRTDIENGITLCETCHVDFHNYYGYTCNSLEQLEEYIQDIRSEIENLCIQQP